MMFWAARFNTKGDTNVVMCVNGFRKVFLIRGENLTLIIIPSEYFGFP